MDYGCTLRLSCRLSAEIVPSLIFASLPRASAKPLDAQLSSMSIGSHNRACAGLRLPWCETLQSAATCLEVIHRLSARSETKYGSGWRRRTLSATCGTSMESMMKNLILAGSPL
jgi:hypothetical protein